MTYPWSSDVCSSDHTDTRIFSPLLYQLSYLAITGRERIKAVDPDAVKARRVVAAHPCFETRYQGGYPRRHS